jgi:hypothetical protein
VTPEIEIRRSEGRYGEEVEVWVGSRKVLEWDGLAVMESEDLCWEDVAEVFEAGVEAGRLLSVPQEDEID